MRILGRRPVWLVAALGTLVALVAASGWSGGSSASADQRAAAAAAPTVKIFIVSGYGKVLANAAGRPLYLLTNEKPGVIKCTGSCTKRWKPLVVKGKPTAGAGTKASLLGTVRRSDGTSQVTYNKHPLYAYSGQGLASGVGLKSAGGTWYLVSAAGKAITSTEVGGY
jgi:predicted lipoprotein with Yx(FWY)xxD motif